MHCGTQKRNAARAMLCWPQHWLMVMCLYWENHPNTQPLQHINAWLQVRITCWLDLHCENCHEHQEGPLIGFKISPSAAGSSWESPIQWCPAETGHLFCNWLTNSCITSDNHFAINGDTSRQKKNNDNIMFWPTLSPTCGPYLYHGVKCPAGATQVNLANQHDNLV